MSKNVQKCPKMSKNVQKCPKMVKNGGFAKCAQIDLLNQLAKWRVCEILGKVQKPLFSESCEKFMPVLSSTVIKVKGGFAWKMSENHEKSRKSSEKVS